MLKKKYIIKNYEVFEMEGPTQKPQQQNKPIKFLIGQNSILLSSFHTYSSHMCICVRTMNDVYYTEELPWPFIVMHKNE